MFKFKDYSFDPNTFLATFNYEDRYGVKYSEHVQFAQNIPYDPSIAEFLNRALTLCFMIMGTSYYKAHPTTKVSLPFKLDAFQANFFTMVYNEGLSQYAFENRLNRTNLVQFEATASQSLIPLPYSYSGIIALQSGGKDSLLTAELLKQARLEWSGLYVGSSDKYPLILDQIGAPIHHITRQIDIEALKKAEKRPDYKNGHVPVTYIMMCIGLIQAILDHKNIVITSIGHEGEEPHSIIKMIGQLDLPVNHQWSKTWLAEQKFADYIHRYISKDLQVGSLLRRFSELKVAELFAKSCWQKYGNAFSSCNVGNYRQQNDNSQLGWCGDCPKCANSYLLFAPFITPEQLTPLFGGDLFTKRSLEVAFCGLLGIDEAKKPFECVGEVNELRQAYSMKLPGYADLPFEVPKNEGFDYNAVYEVQPFAKVILSRS